MQVRPCRQAARCSERPWPAWPVSRKRVTLAGAGGAYPPQLAPTTGTYVGCMFNDYMNLLRQAKGASTLACIRAWPC